MSPIPLTSWKDRESACVTRRFERSKRRMLPSCRHWCRTRGRKACPQYPSSTIPAKSQCALRSIRSAGRMEMLSMDELNLSHLPDLPQADTIRAVAATLWQQPAVIAIWLGGSLARGAGDVYSDIDLRVAVAPADLTPWETPEFEQLFAYSPVVGQQFLRFGDEAFLHHLILANGVLIDFYVQSSECELSPEPHQVLGCRSDNLAVRLAESQTELPTIVPLPPRGEVLRSLLIDFWVNSHKHCKVL